MDLVTLQRKEMKDMVKDGSSLCLTGLILLFVLPVVSGNVINEPSDSGRFQYEYKVLERLVKLEQENANLKQRVQQLEANKTTQVAVKVRLLADQDLSANSRVRYNMEMWNIGNAFDLKNSEFVAPVSGIYFIAVQACLHYREQWMDLDVIRDGATIGRIFTGDQNYHSCGTEATSVHLEAGNKVWVSRAAGTATVLNQDHGWNTFTAALVMAD